MAYTPAVIDPNAYATPSGRSMSVSNYDPSQASFEGNQSRLLQGIANQPAMQANDLKQQRFNTVFPWLQGQLGDINNRFATAGGQSGASPEISVGGVWNPQQIQKQVNTTRAQNDQSAASTEKNQQANLSGQGFGANSPLLQALYGQTQANNLATNTQAETSLRNQAQQENAGQVLNTQQARESQFHNRMQEDIARRTPIWGAYSSLLGALSGLV